MENGTYKKLLLEVKGKIKEAQVKTVAAANSQMLLFYWQLGNYILSNQQAKGWGAKIIDLLAVDLKKEFPQIKGFSSRNLKYMRKFSENYNCAILEAFIDIEQQIKISEAISQSFMYKLLNTDNQTFAIVQQPVAQLHDKNIDGEKLNINTKKSKLPIVQQVVAQLE